MPVRNKEFQKNDLAKELKMALLKEKAYNLAKYSKTLGYGNLKN